MIFFFAPIGFQDASHGEAFGLMEGNIGNYKTGDFQDPITINTFSSKGEKEVQISFWGINDINNSSYYYYTDDETAFKRKKSLYASYYASCFFCKVQSVSYKGDHLLMIKGRSTLFGLENHFAPLFRFEASVGYKYSIRVGFSFSELFDFLLGIVGIDFKEDDIGWQEDES